MCRRERLQAGGDRRAEDLPNLLGQRTPLLAGHDALVGEGELAGRTEDRRLADRLDQLARRVERAVRIRREDDQLSIADDFLVAAALHAQLDRPLAAALGIARADVDVVAERTEALRQRAAEGAGAADDRDLHTGAPSTASASRRRASASRISVRVTIVGIPASSSASASSTTSASIRPL